MNNEKIKIARIVTIPFVFSHILDLLQKLNDDPKFETHIISSKGDLLNELKIKYKNIIFHELEIPREISLWKDLIAILKLWILLRKENFLIVHSHTPKAGLVTAIASKLSMTKVRIHTFTGQVWAIKTGVMRLILKKIDKLIILLNTRCYVDSPSQKAFLINEGVAKVTDLFVLGQGSFGGIDTERFNPLSLKEEIDLLKSELFPSFNGKILIYLGRMNPDKGLIELRNVFLKLKDRYSVKLLLVGPKDTLHNSDFEYFFQEFITTPNVTYVPFTSKPEIYLGVADIFCFPSYREGFGTVSLEAQAMKLPVVASNIYGLKDSISDKESGLLFNVYDENDLLIKLEILINNDKFLNQLGEQARARVLEFFDQSILTKLMINEYYELIDKVHSNKKQC